MAFNFYIERHFSCDKFETFKQSILPPKDSQTTDFTRFCDCGCVDKMCILWYGVYSENRQGGI